MASRNDRVVQDVAVRSPARSFINSLDNFYSPARDTRSEQALDRGLAGFQAIVGEQAAEAKEERRKGEFQQGVADALREQAGKELEGVKTGSIFRQHSRFYMMGLNETRGKAAAARFKAETAQAYADWEGKHTDDDGAAFREWMNGRVGEFTEQYADNEYALAGALPVINETARNYAAQHTGFTTQRLERESFEAYDEIVSGIFTDLADGTVDMDEAVTRLASEADDMYTTDGAAANDRVVGAAIRYANIHNDPDSLLALAKAHTEGKLKLSQVNRERIANAVDAVEADIQREASQANAQATAEQEAWRNETLNNWATALANDPFADMPHFGAVGDHGTYAQMQRMQNSFRTAASNTNPVEDAQARVGLEATLAGASSASARFSALNDFITRNPNVLSGSEVSKYASEIMEWNNPDSLINNSVVNRYRQGFGKKLATFQSDDFGVDDIAVLSLDGERAFNDYMLAKTGQIDMNDVEALRSVVKEAEEYAMEVLAFEYPELMQTANVNQPDVGRSLGAPDAISTQQEAVREAEEQAAQEALEVYQRGAGEEPAPVPESAEEPQAELDLDMTPFDDPFVEADYVPEVESFYGEMVRRFTDGEDDRDYLKSGLAALNDDPEFDGALQTLADKYKVPKAALLAVMDFETGGSFDPSIRNAAGSGATGLIQFMPATARALGTTTEELSKMSRTQQMYFVERYFDQFASRIRGGQVDDLYMAVLWPKAIGKQDGYVIFRQGTKAYEQNRGLDTNGDGTVTKFEAAAKVKRRFYGY